MYSGITGEEFKADIYIGVVYYQRLRHMVSDKFQVRTTGPVHNLTQQPVKVKLPFFPPVKRYCILTSPFLFQGRKRAGGIRFGEMERDSLLAHGASFCLQDRLMNCSDYSKAYVCKLCGSILSPTVNPDAGSIRDRIQCSSCHTAKGIVIVPIPYVFRYLATELMAMGVKMNLDVKQAA